MGSASLLERRYFTANGLCCHDISLFDLILLCFLSILHLFFQPYFSKWFIFPTLTYFLPLPPPLFFILALS